MITVTESAANRIKDMIAKRGSGVGLRVGVTESGCSGYKYALDYAESVTDDDVVIAVSYTHLTLPTILLV